MKDKKVAEGEECNYFDCNGMCRKDGFHGIRQRFICLKCGRKHLAEKRRTVNYTPKHILSLYNMFLNSPEKSVLAFAEGQKIKPAALFPHFRIISSNLKAQKKLSLAIQPVLQRKNAYSQGLKLTFDNDILRIAYHYNDQGRSNFEVLAEFSDVEFDGKEIIFQLRKHFKLPDGERRISKAIPISNVLSSSEIEAFLTTRSIQNKQF